MMFYSMGNSIVHLSSVEEIDRALGQMYKLVSREVPYCPVIDKF